MRPEFQTIRHLSGDLPEQLDILMAANLDAVFPAAALAVRWRGELMLNRAWGWIDPDMGRWPAQPDALFDLASVTKLYTVTAFLAQVSAGLARLDDSLVMVLPEFGRSGPRGLDGGQDPHTKHRLPTPESAMGRRVDPRRVTFRHVLAHVSGLAPWRDVYRAAGPAPTPPDQPDPVARGVRWSHALEALWDYPFVGEPGDQVRYSDLGLMLLGEAVARLNGTPGDLEAAIRSLVLEPLELTSVLFNPARNGHDLSHIAPTEMDSTWRQRRVWGEVHDENACGVGGVAGHAGLFAAALDVAALGQAWLADDPRLGIAPEIMQAARQDQTQGERRGLGWVLKSAQGSSAGDRFSLSSYGHTGFTGTSLWIDPQRQLVVATLTNSVYPGRDKPGTFGFRVALHTLLAALQ